MRESKAKPIQHTDARGSDAGLRPSGTDRPLTAIGGDNQGNLVGLTNAPAEVVQAILASPSSYYVNIHNAEHRGGAVRGQLAN